MTTANTINSAARDLLRTLSAEDLRSFPYIDAMEPFASAGFDVESLSTLACELGMVHGDTDDEDRAVFLACSVYGGNPGDCTVYDGSLYGYGHRVEGTDAPSDVDVLTDDDADRAWDESLDSYLDDCVMPELSDHLASYFDRDAWKRDARHDGRGHCLNSYDGSEESTECGGVYYALFLN